MNELNEYLTLNASHAKIMGDLEELRRRFHLHDLIDPSHNLGLGEVMLTVNETNDLFSKDKPFTQKHLDRLFAINQQTKQITGQLQSAVQLYREYKDDIDLRELDFEETLNSARATFDFMIQITAALHFFHEEHIPKPPQPESAVESETEVEDPRSEMEIAFDKNYQDFMKTFNILGKGIDEATQISRKHSNNETPPPASDE